MKPIRIITVLCVVLACALVFTLGAITVPKVEAQGLRASAETAPWSTMIDIPAGQEKVVLTVRPGVVSFFVLTDIILSIEFLKTSNSWAIVERYGGSDTLKLDSQHYCGLQGDHWPMPMASIMRSGISFQQGSEIVIKNTGNDTSPFFLSGYFIE